jgi:hypothetical protein
VPDDPGEVDNVPQERRNICREISDEEKNKGKNSMKLLTWNACRLLAGGRELALVNLLTSTGADVATITECEIPEGSGEFSVAGYTTYSPPQNAGGKTRVIVLVKNDLSVRAEVKVIPDIMDPAVQSVWLHFNHHKIGSSTQGATLGAFVLGGIYREWTSLLSREESRLRLGSLLTQISKAAEHGSRVAIHRDFNVDLDWGEDKGYYMAKLPETLAECTSAAGLEAHVTSPTFWSFGNFITHPAGVLSRPPGDVASSTGDGQSPAGDFHRYARLDRVYTKGLISKSKVIPDATTDHSQGSGPLPGHSKASLTQEAKLQGNHAGGA